MMLSARGVTTADSGRSATTSPVFDRTARKTSTGPGGPSTPDLTRSGRKRRAPSAIILRVSRVGSAVHPSFRTIRREFAVTQALLLVVLTALVLGAIGWTIWDVRSDVRRRRLK
ncbi:hypothetical protein GCM10023222_43500 [Saccharopolyspora cebuensis]